MRLTAESSLVPSDDCAWPAALPAGWENVWMERVLSSKFARVFPRLGGASEYLL